MPTPERKCCRCQYTLWEAPTERTPPDRLFWCDRCNGWRTPKGRKGDEDENTPTTKP